MATPESHTNGSNHLTENDALESAVLSAIKKQKVAEEYIPEPPLPASASTPLVSPGYNRSNKSWLYGAGLLLLVAAVLFSYQRVFFQQAPVPLTQITGAADLSQQLNLARDMAAELIDEPERLGEVVAVYQHILDSSPAQPEALSGLEKLRRQCLVLTAFFISSGQQDMARGLIDDALEYFPELVDDPHWQSLVNKTLQPAALVEPARAVEVAAAPLPIVKEVAAVSEPVITDNQSAPEAEAVVADAAITQQQIIKQLLLQAEDFNQRGIQFTQRENAVSRYRDVLSLEPGQADAVAGLQGLLDTRIAYVKRLLSEGSLDSARTMLESALNLFPDNLQLQELAQQLQQRGGNISALTLSFLPDNEIDPTRATMGGQTLLISFSYKYFPSTTTVLTAHLYKLPNLEPIADVAIIMQDQRGSKTFHMSTLSRQIEEGRYQLILSVEDKQLIEYDFSVNNGVIISSAVEPAS